MKLLSTDVLALACIAGCGAVTVGATAAFLDGRQSHSPNCGVELGNPASGVSLSRNGDVVVGNRCGVSKTVAP